MEQYIKGFRGFTPVKMCGLSPLASFYFIIVIIIIRRSLESIKQVVQQLHELLVLTFIKSRVAYCDSLLYSFLNSQVIKTLLSLV